MNSISKPRGTKDIYDRLSNIYDIIDATASNHCFKRGYKKIITPTFEHTELFNRGVGETTDIVNKEMYTFKDRSDRSLTLKPEGTAGVIRSFIENKLYATPDLPVKVYYNSTMFRYERPQEGRLREFRQFGIEILGENNLYTDIEMISLILVIFSELGIDNIVLKINSLGTKEECQTYKEKVKEHFLPHINELCEDCKKRINSNPLRILDCKVDYKHHSMDSVPSILSFLDKKEVSRLEDLKSHIKEFLDIQIEIDPTLVRGLDYYNHLVFEIHSIDEDYESLGALAAGGCYDNLIKELGGPELKGAGFSIGIDRIAQILEDENEFEEKIQGFYLAPLVPNAMELVSALSELIVNFGEKAESPFEPKTIKSAIKTAERKKLKWLIIIGEDELKKEEIKIKNLITTEQVEVAISDFLFWFNNMLENSKAEEELDLEDFEFDEDCCCGSSDCNCDHENEEDHCCCHEEDEDEEEEEHHCCCHDEKDHKCDCDDEEGHECGCHEDDPNHVCKCNHHEK